MAVEKNEAASKTVQDRTEKIMELGQYALRKGTKLI
jgi:hypothetical protein